MRRLELVGGALERGVRGAVRRALERRVGDAPVHELGVGRELRAHLSDAVAEGDHGIEALGGELVEVLGAVGADVDAPPCGARGRRSGAAAWVAAGAAGLDRAGRQVLEQRLCDLRPSAVAGAEEQHPAPASRRSSARGRWRRPRVQRRDGAHRRRRAAPRGRRRGRSGSSCRGGPLSCAGRTRSRRRGAGASGTTPGSAVRRPASSTPPRPDRCAPAPAATATAPDAMPAARTAAGQRARGERSRSTSRAPKVAALRRPIK